LHPWTAGSNIPEDQLFFMGGTASVRGFDENMLRVDAYDDSVGGRESLLGNLELRYDLGMNFEATAFYDIGSIRKTENSEIPDSFRSATGLGLRYVTPIGAIGVLYGWKLDPMAGESSGRFHFSIGYTF
jgi:outer membrane protein insertion porin family